MGSLRLLIADDHEIFRAGLRALLEVQPGWRVVAEAADGRDAVKKAAETRPDVALLDIAMPFLNGLEAAQEIALSCPRTKIVMLTVHDSEAMIDKVLAAGARLIISSNPTRRPISSPLSTPCRETAHSSPRKLRTLS